jgi:hypothetical protein
MVNEDLMVILARTVLLVLRAIRVRLAMMDLPVQTET